MNGPENHKYYIMVRHTFHTFFGLNLIFIDSCIKYNVEIGMTVGTNFDTNISNNLFR